MSSIGSMNGISWARKLTVGVENSTATSFSSIDASSSGGTSDGPVVLNSSPLVRVPVTVWSTLFHRTSSTLPSSTCWVNSVNEMLSAGLSDSESALIAVSPSTATSTHTNHEGRPLPPPPRRPLPLDPDGEGSFCSEGIVTA